ncbi:MAG: divergent polysaccharide deacetylase family protein [Campylobacter sp.]|nr:divergent polysaccharide deacetylase family protein [Campylobacter sp.]
MAKKSKKGRKFSRPILKNLIILFLIFCLGFATYGVLEYISSLVSKPQPKKTEVKIRDDNDSLDMKILKSIKPNKELSSSNLDRNLSAKFNKPSKTNATKINALNIQSKDDENLTAVKNKNDEVNKTLKQIFKQSDNQTKAIMPKSRAFKKPNLVIIIDDVATKVHINMIKNSDLNLTPSFLPPTKINPNTPRLSAEFDFFMVHLPLEAIKFNSPEDKTLLASSSQSEIDARISEIRRLFPRAKFINNHTGSKFSKNHASMNRLIKALKANGFMYLDSKTIASDATKKACLKYSMPYIARDLFLDHIDSELEVKKQIQKAVKIAQKRGYAIVIGHPKINTFRALNSSKELLKSVNIINFGEFYELYY